MLSMIRMSREFFRFRLAVAVLAAAAVVAILPARPGDATPRAMRAAVVAPPTVPTLLSIEENLSTEQVNSLAAKLSAMGLLGFDLHQNQFLYLVFYLR